MSFKKTPIALAVVAICAGASFGAQAAPSVTITSPTNGSSVSGTSVGCTASASDSSGISNVAFYLDNVGLNTDTGAPYNCKPFSTSGKTGTHTLKAIATARNGSKTTTQISLNFGGTTSGGTTTPPSGGTTTPPPSGGTTSGNPVVTISKPANGATFSTTTGSVACAATANDSNGIRQLQWYVDGSTLLNTELNAPYDACNLNLTRLANGTHTLKAVATDRNGNRGETQISFTKGTATTPPSGGGTGGGTTSAPTVLFTAPTDGASLPVGSKSWEGTFKCTVNATDADGVSQVQWFLDNTLLQTERSAPYDSCNLDTTKFTPGTHQLRAVATDSKGNTGEAKVSINLGGGSTGGGTTTNTPPSVNLTVNSTLSNTATCTATATDNGSVTKVDFILVNSANVATVVTPDTAAPWACSFDTKAFPNGSYRLQAKATDDANLSAVSEKTVTIANTTTGGGDTVGGGGDSTGGGATSGTGTSLTGASAVATFESLGLYWKPGSAPSDGACTLRYRKKSDSAWKEGLPMWYDPRNAECRGSIVHLEPNTEYAVEMGKTGQPFAGGVNTKTWAENFPIAQTIQVASGSGTLNITQGGSASGYVLYTGPATIDVNNSADYAINISAPYVIVRGLTVKGAKKHAINIAGNVSDVVIENNDISEWGSWSGQTSVDGWKVATEGDSAVAVNCYSTPGSFKRAIIQRNKIHHPRYGASSWSGIQGVSEKHPRGSNAVWFNDCGGNHVIRYNETWSDWGRYFNDILGGFANHSQFGMPSNDSDIYGNILKNAWDDAIESEGGNMNVRIWGNYIDQTTTGIATTSTQKGPVYIFRNVWNRSRHFSAAASVDADDRLYFFKSGSTSTGDGRRYVFHNTMLQAQIPGATMGGGGGQGLSAPGGGQNLTNTVSRNNIFHVYKSWWSSVYDAGGGMTPNNLDNDMVNGNISAYSGAEANRIVVQAPQYKAGHGWTSEAGGNYSLQPGSPGHDGGVRLPNFNDGFMGNGPDVGAHEEGTAAMKLGVSGSGATSSASTTTPTGGTSTTTTTASSGTTGGSTGGLCSTIECAAQ